MPLPQHDIMISIDGRPSGRHAPKCPGCEAQGVRRAWFWGETGGRK